MLGHPARIGKSSPQQHLDLRVEAAELIRRPPTQRVVHGRIEAEQDRLAFFVHEYRVPALTTGEGGWSPQSTTIRLLTMLAVRSSSSSTTPFSLSWLRAIWTMPTAPSTIRERAATTALACWRRSIAWAISAA